MGIIMKKRKSRKISGPILMTIGVLTYLIYWISGYFCEEPPLWMLVICGGVFLVFGGLGFILILTKKDDELDTDLQRTMDERRYNRR